MFHAIRLQIGCSLLIIYTFLVSSITHPITAV